MNEPEGKVLFTAGEAASIFRVSKAMVCRMAREKEILSISLGTGRTNGIRIPREEIERIVEARLRPEVEALAIQESGPKNEGIYLVFAHGLYKIGRSSNMKRRVNDLGKTVPWGIKIVGLFETAESSKYEQRLHARFAAQRENGEWFRLDLTDVEEIMSRHWESE